MMSNRGFREALWGVWAKATFLACLVMLVGARAEADEASATISRQRIHLSDVAPGVPESLSGIDLGPAAPPGRSRFISYREITLKLRSAGVPASTLELPQGMRVFSAARKFKSEELENLVRAPIRDALPPGAHLESVHVFYPKMLSPEVSIGGVNLPRFSMKKGSQRQTFTVEVMWGNHVALRLPVQVELSLDERILSQVIKRGTNVTLSIKKGAVEITTLARTLVTGRVGEMISVRVPVTKKVVSAMIVAPDRVELRI